MHPIITIFCAFTRRWAIDGWLDNLANVQHDPALTNLAFIVDGDEPYIYKALQRLADEKGYRSLHIKHNTGWRPNEIRQSIRRQRVAEIHEQAKDLIAKCDGGIIIGLEDDTVFDRLQNFDRLIEPLQAHDRYGFVEGVQMGRWGAQIIGAWRADHTSSPTHIETLLPPDPNDPEATKSGYEDITGGGWYGYATRKQLFLDAPYFTSPSYPWGPDVNYGFWLQQQGYRCLIDWQTVFGHNDHGQTLYPDDPKIRLAKIIYNKREDNGKWERTDHEQNRY
jgi:hypothetical protein